MSKSKILLQLDPDEHASSFDAVVAIDAGVDQLVQYAGVRTQQVTPLVHGAIFTRGPKQLHHTAIFVGGTNVAAGVELLEAVTKTFFGPMRVSVMLDANGANTTAAAAVLAAGRHLDLTTATALVLAATGPVGQRVVRLLARQGARVRVASRALDRARQVAETIAGQAGGPSPIEAVQTADERQTLAALDGVDLVFAAGAAGVELLSESQRQQAAKLQVAIDLNAVPPLGIGGIKATDKAEVRDGVVCYGAIGVGGTKMKIHTAAIQRLFDSNDQVLDAEEIFALGQELEGESG